MSGVNLYPWLTGVYGRFAKALVEGRLPQAVLICGHEDAGAVDLALECVRLSLCRSPAVTGPCGKCPACTQFAAAGSHQDFIAALATTAKEAEDSEDLLRSITEIKKRTGFASGAKAGSEAKPSGAAGTAGTAGSAQSRYVRVDTLRRFAHLLHEGAAGGGGKTGLVLQAHLMQPAAANAILKVFEEPPPGTLIIMCARSTDSLLPTIVSRAVRFNVPLVPEDEALEYLAAVCPASDSDAQVTAVRRSAALSLSSGLPLGAARLLQGGLMESIEAALRAVFSYFDGRCQATDAALALLPLPAELRGRIFEELVLEIVKYKAGADPEKLSLLCGSPLDSLARLPASALLFCQRDLRFISERGVPGPVRAPVALMAEFLMKLRGEDLES